MFMALTVAILPMINFPNPESAASVTSTHSTAPMHLAVEDFRDAPDPTTTTVASTSTTATRRVARRIVEHAQLPRATRGTARTHRGYATTRECISMVEHGGSYSRSSNPSHFGRYQFSPGSWKAHGGNPAHWGSASPAEQDQVFENAMNTGATGEWTPYDGC